MLFLGITTFLSPCSIALISVYLTFSVGVSESIRRGFVIGCSFATAMCLIFFLLGYALSALIPVNIINFRFFYGVSGVLLIFFGITNLGLFKRIGPRYTRASASFTEQMNALKLTALMHLSKYNYAVGAFMFGIVISLALGPCSLSLVLPAILLTMLSAPTPFHGGILLLAFGLGHGLPVLFLSTLLATARKALRYKTTIVSGWLTRLFGIAFIIIGLIMIGYLVGGGK